MLANTGTVSFVLYGIFIAITAIALFITIYVIKNNSIESEKLDKMIELFKYAIVSVAIATTTLIVSDLFKEREQDIKELEYFDKYADDIKNIDGLEQRFQLTKYLSIVAPSGEMKKSWGQYYDSVNVEYKNYLISKNEKKTLELIPNPSEKQILKLEQLEEKIIQQEAPMVTYEKTTTKNDLAKAKMEEGIGFEFLLKKDVSNAINAFTRSENAYNKYHQVYEISQYLRKKNSELKDANNAIAWKSAYIDIVKLFPYGMPSNIKAELIQNTK